jgi:uncharacterized LabA/DUF88 family protein
MIDQKMNLIDNESAQVEETALGAEIAELTCAEPVREPARISEMTNSAVAVFIDLDNFLIPLYKLDEDQINEKLAEVLNIAKGKGDGVELRAYGDFSRQPYWAGKLLETKGIQMIHTPALNGNGKCSDDMTMAVDIAQLPFLNPRIKTIVVVSADGHFAPAIKAFSRFNQGRKTIVVHTDKVNFVLRMSADECVSLIP